MIHETREERIKSLRIRLARLRLEDVKTRGRRDRYAKHDRISRGEAMIRISNELAELESGGGDGDRANDAE